MAKVAKRTTSTTPAAATATSAANSTTGTIGAKNTAARAPADEIAGAGIPAPVAPTTTAAVPDLCPADSAQYKRFTRAAPATVTARNKLYFVAITCGMWFFQLTGHPEAGWTCCSEGFAKIIEEQVVGQQPKDE